MERVPRHSERSDVLESFVRRARFFGGSGQKRTLSIRIGLLGSDSSRRRFGRPGEEIVILDILDA